MSGAPSAGHVSPDRHGRVLDHAVGEDANEAGAPRRAAGKLTLWRAPVLADRQIPHFGVQHLPAASVEFPPNATPTRRIAGILLATILSRRPKARALCDA